MIAHKRRRLARCKRCDCSCLFHPLCTTFGLLDLSTDTEVFWIAAQLCVSCRGQVATSSLLLVLETLRVQGLRCFDLFDPIDWLCLSDWLLFGMDLCHSFQLLPFRKVSPSRPAQRGAAR